MKDKLISTVIWILLGTLWMYGYFYFTSDVQPDIKDNSQQKELSWEISEEQLLKISERSWIAVDVIQQRLDDWENIRDIVWRTGNE